MAPSIPLPSEFRTTRLGRCVVYVFAAIQVYPLPTHQHPLLMHTHIPHALFCVPLSLLCLLRGVVRVFRVLQEDARLHK